MEEFTEYDGSIEQPTNYRYDLRRLESNALSAYFKFRESDTPETRSEFFSELFDICYAVADISRHRNPNMSPDIPANDCATFIFERVVISKKLELLPRPPYDKFPLQHYIRLSILRYLINPKLAKRTLLSDEEFNKLANVLDYKENHDDNIFYKSLANQVFDDLLTIYSPEEIARLYPISREAIINKINPSNIPLVEIRDFVYVYTTIIRKRFRNSNKIFCKNWSDSSIRKMLHTCLSSSFFLTMLLESDIIDNELLYSLDLDSIIRLVELTGSTQVRIPAKEKLNSLLVAMNIATDMTMNGSDFSEALKKIKCNSHIKCSTNPSLFRLVQMALLAIDLESNAEHSETTFDTLQNTTKIAAEYAKSLTEKPELISDSSLLDKFLILSTNINKTTENIIKLQGFIKKRLTNIKKQEGDSETSAPEEVPYDSDESSIENTCDDLFDGSEIGEEELKDLDGDNGEQIPIY